MEFFGAFILQDMFNLQISWKYLVVYTLLPGHPEALRYSLSLGQMSPVFQGRQSP